MKKIFILLAFTGFGITYATAGTTSNSSVTCDSTAKSSCCSKKGDAKGKKVKSKKKTHCTSHSSIWHQSFKLYAKTEEQWSESA